MRYRFLQLYDLIEVGRLYRLMLEEQQGKPIIHYPQWDETTPQEMQAYLFRQVTENPVHFIAIVAVLGGVVREANGAVHGGKAKGVVLGTIYPRPIGKPKHVGYCELLFVDPEFRGGRGEAAIAVQLIERLTATALERYPDLVLEGAYVPGSHGERLWTRLGMRPYVTYCAYVDDDGNPKPADFFKRNRTLHGPTPSPTDRPA